MATPALIQKTVHAWLCNTPLPNQMLLFDITELYEGGGMWGFTHQGKQYKLRPSDHATEIAVSLPQCEMCRGECIVNALGVFGTKGYTTYANIYVAAYQAEAADTDVMCVLIAFNGVKEFRELGQGGQWVSTNPVAGTRPEEEETSLDALIQ